MRLKEDLRTYNPALQIRITHDMNTRLDRVADMFGVTRGEIARMAIGQYVGQITGTLDQITKSTEEQAKSFDIERMVDLLVPKLIEAQKKTKG